MKKEIVLSVNSHRDRCPLRLQRPLLALGVSLTAFLLLCSGSACKVAKTVAKAAGQTVQIDFPEIKRWTAKSRITIVNGESVGKILPVIDSIDLVRTVTVNKSVMEGKKEKTKKVRETRLIMLGPAEQVTLLISNRGSADKAVSVVLKYYSDDGRFIGVSWPKDYSIPVAPSTTTETLIFHRSDLRTQ